MRNMHRVIQKEMTPVTHRLDMVCLCAGGIAGTEMGHGQDDQPLGPLGRLPVPLDTATGAGMRPMQATF
jgi:hypothetical protein